jgi:hypothetical protein
MRSSRPAECCVSRAVGSTRKRGQRGITQIVMPVIAQHPHRPLLQRGIDLLRHVTILPTQKDAASNP